MFESSRRLASIAYLLAIVGTLYGALVLQRRLLTLLLVLVQIASALWYGASYIPFAQTCLRTSAQQLLPL
jgi:hypothetical protein